MGMEFELKFTCPPEQQKGILEAYPGVWQQIQMQTTYYDTPDGAFAQKKMTLRRRMENGQSICTLKTPEENGVRGEWEVQAQSIEDALTELCKLSGVPQPKAEPVAVCGAEFTRRALQLPLDGCTVELALDTGILLGGGRQCALAEMEVELKDGDAGVAEAFARCLAAKFDLQEESLSKFRRALALARGE